MNRSQKTYKVLILLLVIGSTLSAQVSSLLSSRTAEIGAQNKFTLRVNTNDSSSIEIEPWIADPNLDFFNETPWIKNASVYEKSWDLIAWDSGAYTIPALELSIGNQSFSSKAHNLFVGDIQLPDSTQLLDIKPIIEEQATVEDYLSYIYIILFLGGLIFVFWYVYQSNKKAVDLLDPSPEELKRPAHIIARKALEDLDQKNYLERGKEKEFETSLSFISRRYISSRFNILALEKGNSAFMASLKKLDDFPDNVRTEMLKILPEIELVKYAGQSLPTETHSKYRDLISQLIDQTSADEAQNYILDEADKVLQEAIEEGMQRTLSLGAIKKLNKLLLESGHYGIVSNETILCRWNFKFPFLKVDAAAIKLPEPILEWHENGLSSFFKNYNKLGLRLTNAGVIGTLLFIFVQPLFLLTSIFFVAKDLLQGKRIFGTGNIILEEDNQIRFLYQVKENSKNQDS